MVTSVTKTKSLSQIDRMTETQLLSLSPVDLAEVRRLMLRSLKRSLGRALANGPKRRCVSRES